jgi:hypothetical protein
MTSDSLPPSAGRPAEFPHDIRLFLGSWQNVGIENPIGEVTSTGLSKIPGEWIVSRARTISHWLLPSADATARVVIYETGVWPSGEIESLWWNFVDSHRLNVQQHGEVRILQFGASEAESLASMVTLAILFGWDIRAVQVDSDRRFKIDDDSVVEVWGASQADRASFVSRIAL